MSRLSHLITDTRKIANNICERYNESPAAKAAGLFKNSYIENSVGGAQPPTEIIEGEAT